MTIIQETWSYIIHYAVWVEETPHPAQPGPGGAGEERGSYYRVLSPSGPFPVEFKVLAYYGLMNLAKCLNRFLNLKAVVAA